MAERAWASVGSNDRYRRSHASLFARLSTTHAVRGAVRRRAASWTSRHRHQHQTARSAGRLAAVACITHASHATAHITPQAWMQAPPRRMQGLQCQEMRCF
eukprot:2951282-Pleurochrysis_carterae.AAC.2